MERMAALFRTVLIMRNGMAANEASMSRLLKLAQKFNCFYLSGPYRIPSTLAAFCLAKRCRLQKGDCRPFVVEGHQVGLVRPDVMRYLMRYPDVFHIQPDAVELNPAFRDYSERSAKVEAVLKDCRASNAFIALKGWRDECYEVRAVYSSESLLKMDRSATCLFGIRNYGVDINGYVMDPEKGLCIWLQQRSATKQTWPGKWDNMVAGGLSVGYTIMQTAIKEAAEEASIPLDLMQNLRPAGSVSFFFESERGLFPNTEFVFDLELPLDFIPHNSDGEVERFQLLPAAEVLERVFSPEFKTTSCPVVVDFLVRHGLINPENEPNLPQVIELLHAPLQTMYRSRYLIPPAENGQNNML